MKTQILLVILQLNKPLSTSYRSRKSSSLSFWSPNYGSNLHKGHFPSYSACCDMIHAFCLLLRIWGCLWRAVINTASNSSFHKMLYSQEKKKKENRITYVHRIISIPIAIWCYSCCLYTSRKDVRAVSGRHSGAHVAVLELVVEWHTGSSLTVNLWKRTYEGRKWNNKRSGAGGEMLPQNPTCTPCPTCDLLKKPWRWAV